MNWENKDNSSLLQWTWSLIAHNGWLKILSLIFSVVLYLMITTEEVKEYSKIARVKIITAPQVIVNGPAERTLDVRVRLPNFLFSEVPSENDLVGELDVSRAKLGKMRVRLGRENFPRLDKQYALELPDPWIEVELDTLFTKNVGIRAVLQGRPKDGLSIDQVILEPDTITVQGAKKELSRIETLSTSPIIIEDIDKSLSSITKIVTEDFSSIKIPDDKVTVQVVIGAKRVSRVFKGIMIKASATANAEFSPADVEVEVQGSKEVIDRLDAKDFGATIDTSDLSSSWQPRKVQVEIPKNTSLVRVNPEIISVKSNQK